MLSLVVVFGIACNSAVEKTEEKSNSEVKEKSEPDETAEDEDLEKESGVVMASGTLEGKSDHKTSGKVNLIKRDDGYVLELAKDFKFDGAPDPKWAFGKGGFKKDTVFAKLKKNDGYQRYDVPATVKIEDLDEVWLWCEQFNVPLGMAKLSDTASD